jgi:hypothetical protein
MDERNVPTPPSRINVGSLRVLDTRRLLDGRCAMMSSKIVRMPRPVRRIQRRNARARTSASNSRRSRSRSATRRACVSSSHAGVALRFANIESPAKSVLDSSARLGEQRAAYLDLPLGLLKVFEGDGRIQPYYSHRASVQWRLRGPVKARPGGDKIRLEMLESICETVGCSNDRATSARSTLSRIALARRPRRRRDDQSPRFGGVSFIWVAVDVDV